MSGAENGRTVHCAFVCICNEKARLCINAMSMQSNTIDCGIIDLAHMPAYVLSIA